MADMHPIHSGRPTGDVMADHGPIFIIGDVRSGTTLLRLVLDSHPHIAIGPESAFMRAAAATRTIPYWKYGDGWYRRFGWTDEEFDEHLRNFYSTVFNRLAAAEGKARWGDKTPLHLWHMRDMARIFPDADFVGIVRHPGGAASSRAQRWSEPFDAAVDGWVSANSELLRAAADVAPGRVVICRYEDLVLHTRDTMGEVLGFLGEPWSDRVLDHAGVQEAKGTPRLVDGHTNSRQPVQDDAVFRWLTEASDDQKAYLEERAGALAARFGYRTAE